MTDEHERWWGPPERGTLKVNFAPRGEGAPDCLQGSWAKWERAVEHRWALHDAGREWLDRPAFDVAVEYDDHLAAHVASFVVRRQAPARLASFGKRPALMHFEPDARDRIVDFQFFESSNRGLEPLLVLGRLSNIDKHRLILVGAAAVRLRETRFSWKPEHLTGSGEFLLKDGDPFDDGTRFGVIRFGEGGHPDAVVSATLPASELRLTYDGKGQVGPLMVDACIWRVREIIESFEAMLRPAADIG